MATNLITELKTREAKIRELQKTKAHQDGQREQLMSQLQSDFDVKTVAEACEKLTKIDEEVADHEKTMKELIEEMDAILNKNAG